MNKWAGRARGASLEDNSGVERRGLLRLGTLATAITGVSAVSGFFAGVSPAVAASPDKNPPGAYVPTSEKGAAAGVATLDNGTKIPFAQIPDLSPSYSPTDGGDTTNRRCLSLGTPTFDGQFTFSKISGNQDGLIAVKNLTVTGGFGGQVGQGGAISYFKAVGIAAHHSGPGNYDHFWGSVYHDGTREAGMFIGDVTGRRGGNVYGGHFRVQSNTTAPPYLVGLVLEIVPNVSKDKQTTATVATAVAANTAVTAVELSAAVQLTTGTNLAFTAADSTTVTVYVSASMPTPSRIVPVTSFVTASPIYAGGPVTLGVNSTYLGLDIQNHGSQSASAAISVSHHGTATDPFTFGLNFDSSSSSMGGTAIMVGGSWGSGLNMNANSIVQAGSIAGTGSSPDRDVRLADNLLLDNARHIKFKDSAGTPRKAISATSTNNMRFNLMAGNTQYEFYDSDEKALLGRITSSGRADFSLGGVTTKYTASVSQPSYLTNGQVEVWHDTGSGTDYLVVNVNGVSKKVALT